MTKFSKFCDRKLLNPGQKTAFENYIRLKYGVKIPRKLDLSLEYRRFLAEATSRS